MWVSACLRVELYVWVGEVHVAVGSRCTSNLSWDIIGGRVYELPPPSCNFAGAFDVGDLDNVCLEDGVIGSVLRLGAQYPCHYAN